MTIVDVFKLQNPWRNNVETAGKPDYIERDIWAEIVNWLDDKDILLILGPRQSGKTTLLKRIIRHLIDQKKNPDQLFYFNLDSEELIELFKNPHDFVKFIKSYQPGSSFVFIDEAQRVDNAGLFLKNICDLESGIKLITSGSSSLELKAKTKEYLTGRKKEFFLYPFSFREFLGAQKILPPAIKLDNWTEWEEFNRVFGPSLLKNFTEYAVFGGYPKVVLRQTMEQKIKELEELYKSYIKKDIEDLLKIADPVAFNKLVSLTAFQIGNLVNKYELSTATGSSWRTIEKYLTLLEETFILKLLPPFSSNRRKEIVRMPKGYYLDSGLRNFIVKNFDHLEGRGDKGQLTENFCFKELAKMINPPQELCFWRTQAKAEVDFVVVSGEAAIPLEVKFSAFKKPAISRSFKNFIESYSPTKALVLTRDFLAKSRVHNSEIIFLPAYLLPFYSGQL